MSEEKEVKVKKLSDKKLEKLAAKYSGPRYKTSFSDKMISVITYVVYIFFAFVCLYPFYYIFINTISNNDLSNQGKIIFLPQEIHFENYKRVFQIDGLFHAFEV